MTPGKKINGRKRHAVVDTLGLLLGPVVHAADIQDRDGAPAVPASIRCNSRSFIITHPMPDLSAWPYGRREGHFCFGHG